MTARILVVDDVPANVKLLEVRLQAEYFEVLTARNGPEALEICGADRIDVVLLDVMMPGMDGFEVCQRLKADPATQHIPVVMVTSLDQVKDRVRGLEVGADDFLTKPVNDLQLMTRVKSLVRLKLLTDELRLRAATTRNIGIEALLTQHYASSNVLAKVLLIDEQAGSADRIGKMLRGRCELSVSSDPNEAYFRAADGDFDCIIISTAFHDFDPLRLCSQLRTLDRTRFVPLMLIADDGEEARLVRGLELGVNDYLMRPVDQHELIARLTTQLRRKRYNDHLRMSVAQTIEMAVTDGLTGLHNRRYLDSHLATLFERARNRVKPLALMMLDIDRFKSVNDTWGHDAGDEVLCEFATRLRTNIRGIDLVCRMGGEEFVVVMPDTDAAIAAKVAERVRTHIASTPFIIGTDGREISITASIGITDMIAGPDTIPAMLKRADVALYQAKNNGRNCVVAMAA